MQEEFLASRIISYTSLQMTWQCSTLHKIEAERPPSSPIMNASLFRNLNSIVKQQSSKPGAELESLAEHQDDLYSLCYHIATLHSERNLSVAQDRLPAIAGLAKRVQFLIRDSYCAGLWRNDLVMGLLWYSVFDKEKISAEYRGQSWSWVAVDSGLVK